MSDHRPQDGIDRTDDDAAGRALRQRFGAALADTATWTEPDSSLADSVLARIAAERDGDPTSDDQVVEPAPLGQMPPEESRRSVPVRRPSVRRYPHGGRLWFAAAAAAAVVAVGVGVVLARSDGSEPAEQIAIAGTELSPDASADAAVDDLAAGVAIRLEIMDLAPAPEGSFYQGWVKNEAGDLVTVGTFHMRGGDDVVTLWSGVSLDDYPLLTVTLQREGEGPESSGEVVLTGRLTD